jgi:hypothetical protein
MSRKCLLIIWLPVLFVLSWHHSVSASPQIECCNKRQTQAIAKLKDGDFIRVRMASKRDVSGYFRTFDGSRLVIEDKGNLVTIQVADIVVIERGRGFWGSVRKGFSRAGRTLASPVTDLVLTYQMMKWFNEAP